MRTILNKNKMVIGSTCLILIVTLLIPILVFASTSLRLRGFGAESIMMGPGDSSVTRENSGLNTNPAGLVQILERQQVLYSVAAGTPGAGHQDLSKGDKDVLASHVLLGDIGYANRFKNYPVAVGIGFYVDKNIRYDFQDVTEVIGTKNDFNAFSQIARITPVLAIQITPSLFLGANLEISYSDLDQKVFSSTTIFNSGHPRRSFFVYNLEGTEVVSMGYKLGAIYRLKDWFFLGAAYTSKADLHQNGGSLISDLSGAGLGKVTYSDVRLKGFVYPQELGFGVVIYPTKRLMASLEMDWIDWSDAIKTSTLHAGSPDNPYAPLIQAYTADINLRDQVVTILSLSYKAHNNLVFRAGYNFATNPSPDGMSNPLLATIGHKALSSGAALNLSSYWRIDGGIEYEMKEDATYAVRIIYSNMM